MHLYKRNKIWWLEYMSGGKRYRQSCHTQNRKVAQLMVDAIKTSRKMPTFEEAVEVLRVLYGKPREGALSLGSAWETYEEIARSIGRDKISETTFRKRAGNLRQFCEWAAKEAATVKTVEGVTPPVAAQYAAHLQRLGKKSKTRKNIIGDLSTVWRILEKASENIRNPWVNLAPTDDDGERGKAFTAEEVELVQAAARKVGREWPGVITMALNTGLRYGDIALMTWRQVDGGVIRVTPRKTARHGIQTAFPIGGELAAMLEGLPRRGDFLFPLHADMYQRHSGSWREKLPFKEVLISAGLDGQGFTFHSLRHTVATRLAEAGVAIETRKRILGHTEDATAARYDHDEHLREVREALAAANKKPRKA